MGFRVVDVADVVDKFDVVGLGKWVAMFYFGLDRLVVLYAEKCFVYGT